MGHFSTVNEKVATEGGDPSPIGVSFLFLLLPFQLPPLTPPSIPQMLLEYLHPLSTQVFCFCPVY